MTRRGLFILVPFVALLMAAAAAVKPRATPSPPTTNKTGADATSQLGERIVAFCRTHMGEQVGDGECASLAGKALHESGAHRRTSKDSPEKGDYVWGKQVYLIEAGGKREGKATDIHPGDVIQYRDVKFAGQRRSGRGTYKMSFPHHTAVVSSTEDAGQTIHIFQQNVGGKRVVMTSTLHLQDLKSGWMRFYRPEPLPDSRPATQPATQSTSDPAGG